MHQNDQTGKDPDYSSTDDVITMCVRHATTRFEERRFHIRRNLYERMCTKWAFFTCARDMTHGESENGREIVRITWPYAPRTFLTVLERAMDLPVELSRETLEVSLFVGIDDLAKEVVNDGRITPCAFVDDEDRHIIETMRMHRTGAFVTHPGMESSCVLDAWSYKDTGMHERYPPHRCLFRTQRSAWAHHFSSSDHADRCFLTAMGERVNSAVPREARYVLDEGFTLAGGFPGRLACRMFGYVGVDGKDAPEPSDLDFFLVGPYTEAEGIQKVRRVLLTLMRDCVSHNNGMCVWRTNNAITIAMDDCNINIQIILRVYHSVDQLLSSFDLEPARVAYRLHERPHLIASKSFRRCVESGTILIDRHWFTPLTVSRVKKYVSHGFSLFVDGTLLDVDMEPDATIRGLVTYSNTQRREADAPSDGTPPPIGSREIDESETWPSTTGTVEEEWESESVDEVHTPDCCKPRHCDDTRLLRWNLPLDTDGIDDLWRLRHYHAPPEHKSVNVIRRKRVVSHQSQGYSWTVTHHNLTYEWRMQRRRLKTSGSPHWRLHMQQVVARALVRDGAERIKRARNSDPSSVTPRRSHIIPGVVFQQFDASLRDGSWNRASYAALMYDTEQIPLNSLDMIEDAQLVLDRDELQGLSRHIRMRCVHEDPFFPAHSNKKSSKTKRQKF